MNKKISIIIPTYNEQESLPFLYEKLNEIMAQMQNYDFEILFINDGSKDKSLEIIKKKTKDTIMLIFREILDKKLQWQQD